MLDGLMGNAIRQLEISNSDRLSGEMLVSLLGAEKMVRDTGYEVIMAWERVWCVYATFVVVELAVSSLFTPSIDRVANWVV